MWKWVNLIIPAMLMSMSIDVKYAFHRRFLKSSYNHIFIKFIIESTIFSVFRVYLIHLYKQYLIETFSAIAQNAEPYTQVHYLLAVT